MNKSWQHLIELALSEDLSETGDVTSTAVLDRELGSASLVARQNGVLAGLPVFEDVFAAVDKDIVVKTLKRDGEQAAVGDCVATVQGRLRSILTAERTALNFVGFLSGIATATADHVAAAKKSGRAILLDTRKTLPGFRQLSKYAVRMGGGQNHRMGLYDMVLLKDNHIDACGGISRAVEKVRSKWGSQFRIEVECRTLEEVREAIACKPEIIMLDNMTPEKAREALAIPHDGILFESSGDMNPQTIGAYSAAGVDYISVGRITHSAGNFNFSLQVKNERR